MHALCRFNSWSNQIRKAEVAPNNWHTFNMLDGVSFGHVIVAACSIRHERLRSSCNAKAALAEAVHLCTVNKEE